MTIGNIIETVYTAIGGGRPNTDFSVLRVDIKALLPAAVNWAVTQDYWANLKNEGEREVPNYMITVKEDLPISIDRKGRSFVELTEKLINVGGNGGIRYVEDDCGNNYVPRVPGSGSNYWDNILQNKEYSYLNKNIYLYNVPELLESVNVGLVLDASELKDDDEAPIPAGMEPQVIDMLTQFFTKQRMQAKDYIINGVDPLNEV